MALPVVDTKTTNLDSGFGKSSYTITHDSGTGNDRYLTVTPVYKINGSETITGITYNGVSMTLIDDLLDGDSGAHHYKFGLIAPATGTNDIVITFNTGSDNEFTLTAITYTGVHQTTPLGTAVSNSGTEASNTDPTVTVSTASGELVEDSIGQRAGATYTVGANQTEQSNIVQGFTHNATSTQDGADGGVMSWSTPGTNKQWSIIAVPIKPVAVGGTRPQGPLGHPLMGAFGGPI